ncbi:MAG TPA: acyl-CoA synthetase FdrA [Alphaproteobacteria bacterium]|nr:acyl-CoA synthetase FdrA [Alphaproteobacteria bacterium]
MPIWNMIRRSTYHDSVTLMRVTRDLESLPGVRRAAVMMGTPANCALLHQAGLLNDEGEAASANDLIIALEADHLTAVHSATAAVERILTAISAASPTMFQPWRPRTLRSAQQLLPGANLTLISVPGVYAAAEAKKALLAGLHVMLFSDNVPLATEIELKRLARSRQLLLMGPDCGTAILNGVPLGFANAVSRGRIGLAAAAGTGLQQVSCLIDAAGEGISQAIGVGSRDLSDEVGGIAMEQALAALAADTTTAVVGVIGKPPGAATWTCLRQQIAQLGKPCVVCLAGARREVFGSWRTAVTLEDAAQALVALARGQEPAPVEFTVPADAIAQLIADTARRTHPAQRFVRGLYAGGTLAYEAVNLLQRELTGVAPGVDGGGEGHRVIDLGADRFTIGRPHPMLDGAVRREWILREGHDPATAVLLLDVVLGYGVHADPAGDILPAIQQVRRQAQASGRYLTVVASVCGTDHDPQHRPTQTAALQANGVVVMPSNAQAARLAARIAACLGGEQSA